MKSTRKLIPALVMLLVSAVMLSTASFAWLADSTEVFATDMTVKANTDVVFMQISNNQTDWDRSVPADDSTATSGYLELVNAYVKTVEDTKSIAWRTAVGEDPDKSDKSDADYSDVATINGTYALMTTFYVKMSNADSKLYNLTISDITLGTAIGNADAFDNALRVLVVAEQDDKVVGYQCWDVGVDGLYTEHGFSASDVLADEVTSEVTTLNVYIYYDGEDAVAYTDNISTAIDEMEVAISFSGAKTNS